MNMHLCPGCDQPNHGMQPCQSPHRQSQFSEYGHIIKRHQSPVPAPVTQDNRIFIGSGEDVVLEQQ